jgi:isocitrate dehydrogenase kinase/phosphatase
MTTKPPTDSRLANHGANAIWQAFDNYCSQFNEITKRARYNFENCDWHKSQADALERLNLYKKIIDQVVTEVCQMLDPRRDDKLLWASIKAVYSGLIAGRDDWELAETFFNSVTRRIFTTVGLDPQIEFVATDFESPPTPSQQPVFQVYNHGAPIPGLIETILKDYAFQTPYEDLERDVRAITEYIEHYLHDNKLPQKVERIEMIRSVFYRRKGAYLVGRIFSGSRLIPFGLALLNSPGGLMIDAVMLGENEVAILFSFTRSYFHVEAERPYDLVRFLKSLMPNKRVAELYISIGYNKHGKTELYRDLLNHLETTEDKFEIAKGERGMVMVVFNLPSFDVVFKLIKDHFDYPKTSTRREVMQQYHMVFQHDRAGRLVDAQEFEHLKFERNRFTDDLLTELLKVAAQTVTVEGDNVIVKHCYVERRVTPLNLYVHQVDEDRAKAAVIDCGNAIKDLAATNIFTGDMLLKNFGVTRHGRVVFYDYDELCMVTDCSFRIMPETDEDDELYAEPSFAVGENDVFPEEFTRFLGLRGGLRETFVQHHRDLFGVEFWQKMQALIKAGEIIDIYPYGQQRRLKTGEQAYSGTAYAETFNNL